MIRLVRDFVATPMYVILCDIPSCMNMGTYPIPQLDSVAAAATGDPIMPFLQQLERMGWGINLLQHRCAGHQKIAREALAQQQSRIVVPNGPLPNGRKH